MSGTKKFIYFLGILASGLILTLLSSYYPQKYQAAINKNCEAKVGNDGGFCYEFMDAGGFPFPYLLDSPFTATKGTLAFDDTIHKFMFFGDFVVWSFLTLVVVFVTYLLLNRGKT